MGLDRGCGIGYAGRVFLVFTSLPIFVCINMALAAVILNTQAGAVFFLEKSFDGIECGSQSLWVDGSVTS